MVMDKTRTEWEKELLECLITKAYEGDYDADFFSGMLIKILYVLENE